MWRFLAIVLGIGGTLLAALAILVNYGYLTTAFSGGYTALQLAAFASLAIVGAIACEAVNVSEHGKRTY